MSALTLALMFSAVSTMFHIPPRVLSSVCYVESKHNIHAINLVDRGGPSLGICEIKLSTARHMGFRGTSKELMEPFTNIYYAGQYLSKHIAKYRSVKKGIIAYNVGHYTPTYKKYYNKVVVAYNEGR